MMSKPRKRREYDVYIESELFLGITFGEFMVPLWHPPNAEVFKVREVLEGDTEAADEIERLRGLLKTVSSESYWDDQGVIVPHELFDKIDKELNDERVRSSADLDGETADDLQADHRATA